MNKNLIYIAATVTSSLIIYNLFIFSISNTTEDENYLKDFNESYKIFAIPPPHNITFAGEMVPMHRKDVQEKLDKELLVNTYWQSKSVLLLKKTARWFPVIEPILKKNGIPLDFKYLPMIESGFEHVVSPAKASGFWQIMESTGKGGGLEIRSEVDERYHLEKATQLACDYLNRSYKKYKNWTLSAASYNIGMRNLNTNMEFQDVDNYYDLLLNVETGRYVYRLIAMKRIYKNQIEHGYQLRDKDLYNPIETYTVDIDSTVQLVDFAHSQGVSYKVIRTFNPWLRKSTLTVSNGKTYHIKIPKNKAEFCTPLDIEEISTADSNLTDSSSIKAIQMDTLSKDSL
ncbi:MAG: lytic transglycosylase domain-containing protein [Flavobacteriales bacterium]|nr:lytic transglycosylase domain-containing protein [Flavobacteriales bacterium]